jgi:hypothetical protein
MLENSYMVEKSLKLLPEESPVISRDPFWLHLSRITDKKKFKLPRFDILIVSMPKSVK